MSAHETAVQIEPTANAVSVDAAETIAVIEAVDISTTYYWLHPGQTLPEHQEVPL